MGYCDLRTMLYTRCLLLSNCLQFSVPFSNNGLVRIQDFTPNVPTECHHFYDDTDPLIRSFAYKCADCHDALLSAGALYGIARASNMERSVAPATYSPVSRLYNPYSLSRKPLSLACRLIRMLYFAGPVI